MYYTMFAVIAILIKLQLQEQKLSVQHGKRWSTSNYHSIYYLLHVPRQETVVMSKQNARSLCHPKVVFASFFVMY